MKYKQQFGTSLLSNFSLFADVRGYATFIGNSQSLFCNSSNCKWLVDADLMWQGQINMGAKLAF